MHTHTHTRLNLRKVFSGPVNKREKQRNRKTQMDQSGGACWLHSLTSALRVPACISSLSTMLFFSSSPTPTPHPHPATPVGGCVVGKRPRDDSRVGLTIASAPAPPSSISVGFSQFACKIPTRGKLRWRGDTGQRKAADAAPVAMTTTGMYRLDRGSSGVCGERGSREREKKETCYVREERKKKSQKGFINGAA